MHSIGFRPASVGYNGGMEQDGLSAYVAEQITQGVPAQAVKEALLEAGWLSVDADNAIRDAAAQAAPVAVLSAHEDMIRIRHAVNSLDERVGRLEAGLVASGTVPMPVLMAPSTMSPARELAPSHRRGLGRRWLLILVLLGAFAASGYWGMALIAAGSYTPLARIVTEGAVGLALTVTGYIAGRTHRRGAANVFTAVGLALCALATVGAWYLHWMEWSVAAAVGALLATLALVLGRFYDRWAMR